MMCMFKFSVSVSVSRSTIIIVSTGMCGMLYRRFRHDRTNHGSIRQTVVATSLLDDHTVNIKEGCRVMFCVSIVVESISLKAMHRRCRVEIFEDDNTGGRGALHKNIVASSQHLA